MTCLPFCAALLLGLTQVSRRIGTLGLRTTALLGLAVPVGSALGSTGTQVAGFRAAFA